MLYFGSFIQQTPISPPVPPGTQEQSHERGPNNTPISQMSEQRIIWAGECQPHRAEIGGGSVSSLKDGSPSTYLYIVGAH